MRRTALSLLAILSVAALVPGLPAFARGALGFLQVLYLPGALFLFLFWRRRASALEYLFVAPIFSALILSVLVTVLFVPTRSIDAALAISTVVIAAALLVSVALRRHDGPPDSPEPFPRGALAAPLLFGAFVGALYLLNPYLVARSDVMHHGPIVDEILQRGIPPLDPRLPASPIQYMWFYHVFVACLVERTGLSVLAALATFNTVTAAIFPYLVARAASRYARRGAHVIAAQWVACVGLASASWILVPVALAARASTGEVKGIEEFVRSLRAFDLGSYQIIYFLAPYGTFMVNMIDRFLTISAFNLGVDLFALFLAVAPDAEFWERRRVAAPVSMIVILAGALLTHIVTGVVLIGLAIGTGVVLFLGRALLRWERAPRFALLHLPGSGVIAALACLPYFLTLSRAGTEGGSLARTLSLGATNALTVFAPLVGLFFVAPRLARRVFLDRALERRMMLAWLLGLLALIVFVDLPGIAELKFALLYLLVLALPVSIELVDWFVSRGRRGRVLTLVWLAILFVPPVVLTARGFLLDKPPTEALRQDYLPDRDRRAVFSWIANETPPSAVVVEYHTLTLAPMYAHRHVFLPPPPFIGMQFYKGEDIEGLAAVHGEIFSPGPPSAKTLAYLRALGLDFYVVLWAEDLVERPDLAGAFESPGAPYERVFANRAGSVYRVRTDPDR